MPTSTSTSLSTKAGPTRDQIERWRWLLANAAWRAAGPGVEQWLTRAVALLKAGTITRDQLQWAIDHLAALPLRGIPDGMYVLGDHCYKVRTPTSGRWAGVTGVSAVNAAGAGVALRGQQRRSVLAGLRDIHVEAALRYGRETLRCPYCRHSLEDPTSRRVGTGRWCAAARAIPWK
jgi:hypothetical protein